MDKNNKLRVLIYVTTILTILGVYTIQINTHKVSPLISRRPPINKQYHSLSEIWINPSYPIDWKGVTFENISTLKAKVIESNIMKSNIIYSKKNPSYFINLNNPYTSIRVRGDIYVKNNQKVATENYVQSYTYSKAESDNRFVNVYGDIMYGNLNMNRNNIINVNEIQANKIYSNEVCLGGVCKNNWSSLNVEKSIFEPGDVYSIVKDEITSSVKTCSQHKYVNCICWDGNPCSKTVTHYFEIRANENAYIKISPKITLSIISYIAPYTYGNIYSAVETKASIICYKNKDIILNFTKEITKNGRYRLRNITKLYNPHIDINISKGDIIKCVYTTYTYGRIKLDGIGYVEITPQATIDISVSYNNNLFSCISGICNNKVKKIFYTNCSWVHVHYHTSSPYSRVGYFSAVCPSNKVMVGLYYMVYAGVPSEDSVKILCCELGIPG